MVSLAHRIEDGLPPVTVRLLREAGDLAERLGFPLYLVGGPVRDLFLGSPVLDVDLMAEGDASVLSGLLTRELGGKILARSRFGTVRWHINQLTVDLATARSEIYSYPGALPQVRPDTLQKDMERRDFSVNAMAVKIWPGSFGDVVDPFDGQRDLASKILRVLHSNSFTEDATRLLRAIRYEVRLGFRMEMDTEKLARRDVQRLDTISGDRLRKELDRLLNEPQPYLGLERAHELGVLQAVCDGFRWPVASGGVFEELHRDGRCKHSLFYLAFLVARLTIVQADAVVERLKMPSRWRRVVRSTMVLRERISALSSPDISPSYVVTLLQDMEPEAIRVWGILADDNMAREWLGKYRSRLSTMRPTLDGDDLLSLGVPQGPLIGEALASLSDACLDGVVHSRKEEEALVRRWLAERGS